VPRVLLTSAGPQHGIDKLTETHVAVPVLGGETRGRTHRERENRGRIERDTERGQYIVWI
jgi:hypothetical protein